MWLKQGSREKQDGMTGVVAFAAAVLVAMFLALTNATMGFERGMRDARDSLRLAPSSGDIVIVEIDGRSLQELDQWPWPRSYHADAIAKLDALGADQIAFDVDFSAVSSEQEDARFAEALASLSQTAILPTFKQENTAGDRKTVSEALPLPAFREASFLASVNVTPSANGRIIQYSTGVTTGGMPRPSLANMLSKKPGSIGDTFRVDQAIDIRTIPRISFVDLIDGRVPRDQVEGKSIVIGATAIELGDRYPTALFGVQPGVVVQVQAAETLSQDRVRETVGQWTAFLIVAFFLGLFVAHRARQGRGAAHSSFVACALGVMITGAALVLDQTTLPYIELTLAFAFVGVFLAVRRILISANDLRIARLTDTKSDLPNRVALETAVRLVPKANVVAARFASFSEVTTALGSDNLAELDRAIARRLKLIGGVEEVYRLDRGLFGLFMAKGSGDNPAQASQSGRAMFNSPFEIAGERLRLEVHFGGAQGSIGDAEDASEMARKRGLAWSSNARGLHEETQYRQRVLSELDYALANGAITLAYQPKLRFNDSRIASGECLVRWNSESMGPVSPADFIPILEERGRIKDLTMHFLREAIDRIAEANGEGHSIGLAVNVSAQLLSDAVFLKEATELLRTSDASSSGKVTLEITESAPMADSGGARKALEQLAKAGARISIDDYGTGQASLNYLQDFPAQEVKLDQSFVRNLTKDHRDRIMVQSTIELAHALGFDIVAEGIEDAETLRTVAELGCDFGQGWEIGRPMPWDEFKNVLGPRDQEAAAA